MISKNRIKAIRQLENKKYRRTAGLFVAEGPKVVADLMEKNIPVTLIAVEQWMEAHPQTEDTEVICVSEDELRRVSFLQHPQQVMGLFQIPTQNVDLAALAKCAQQQLCIVLDGVRDPGNLGTIIRIADWFGIDTIICSEDCADVYSPKVVQATMGSIARVRVTYAQLEQLMDMLPREVPVYGTVLDGEDIYQTPLSNVGLLVMGNEGRGISPEIIARLTHKLLIPNYPPQRDTADSLNVAIATAISCAEFRRRLAVSQ